MPVSHGVVALQNWSLARLQPTAATAIKLRTSKPLTAAIVGYLPQSREMVAGLPDLIVTDFVSFFPSSSFHNVTLYLPSGSDQVAGVVLLPCPLIFTFAQGCTRTYRAPKTFSFR